MVTEAMADMPDIIIRSTEELEAVPTHAIVELEIHGDIYLNSYPVDSSRFPEPGEHATGLWGCLSADSAKAWGVLRARWLVREEGKPVRGSALSLVSDFQDSRVYPPRQPNKLLSW